MDEEKTGVLEDTRNTSGCPPIKNYADEERIMLSAIEHYSYCPRQCALVHMEKVWDENIFTTKGKISHDNVEHPSTEEIDDIRIEKALPLWSDQLGLSGKADVVEFHGNTPYPVEYKLTKLGKNQKHIDLQLCAQAMCLEEMTGQKVPRGAIYHCSSRRRREVMFTEEMRKSVADIVLKIRLMLACQKIPSPVNDKRCKNCSLIDCCLPDIADRQKTLTNYKAIFIPDERG